MCRQSSVPGPDAWYRRRHGRPVSCPHCDHGADILGSSSPHTLQTESHRPRPALAAAILEELKTPEPQRQSPCRDRHRNSQWPLCWVGAFPKNKCFHPTPEEKKSHQQARRKSDSFSGPALSCDADDAVAQARGAIVSRGLGDVCGDDSLSLLQPHRLLDALLQPPPALVGARQDAKGAALEVCVSPSREAAGARQQSSGGRGGTTAQVRVVHGARLREDQACLDVDLWPAKFGCRWLQDQPLSSQL